MVYRVIRNITVVIYYNKPIYVYTVLFLTQPVKLKSTIVRLHF